MHPFAIVHTVPIPFEQRHGFGRTQHQTVVQRVVNDISVFVVDRYIVFARFHNMRFESSGNGRASEDALRKTESKVVSAA